MNAIVPDKILYCDAPLRDAVPYLPPYLDCKTVGFFSQNQ